MSLHLLLLATIADYIFLNVVYINIYFRLNINIILTFRIGVQCYQPLTAKLVNARSNQNHKNIVDVLAE